MTYFIAPIGQGDLRGRFVLVYDPKGRGDISCLFDLVDDLKS